MHEISTEVDFVILYVSTLQFMLFIYTFIVETCISIF